MFPHAMNGNFNGEFIDVECILLIPLVILPLSFLRVSQI